LRRQTRRQQRRQRQLSKQLAQRSHLSKFRLQELTPRGGDPDFFRIAFPRGVDFFCAKDKDPSPNREGFLFEII